MIGNVEKKRGGAGSPPRKVRKIANIDKLRDPHHFEMVLNAIGSNTRMKIMRIVSKEAKPIRQIAKEMGLSQAACSAQVKILWSVGFLKRERRGNQTFYRLNKSLFLDFQRIVREYLGID